MFKQKGPKQEGEHETVNKVSLRAQERRAHFSSPSGFQRRAAPRTKASLFFFSSPLLTSGVWTKSAPGPRGPSRFLLGPLPNLTFRPGQSEWTSFSESKRTCVPRGTHKTAEWRMSERTEVFQTQHKVACSRMDLLERGTRLLGYSCFHFPYRFLPRLFLCPPSFRRCGVTSAVCCGSGCNSLLPLVSLSLLIWSAVEDVGRALLLQARRRLVEPEHCARRCVQCHHKS